MTSEIFHSYTRRKCCITFLYHGVKNTVTNSINATLRSAHDGKVWCFTIEYVKGLLYFDWLYFSMASMVYIHSISRVQYKIDTCTRAHISLSAQGVDMQCKPSADRSVNNDQGLTLSSFGPKRND